MVHVSMRRSGALATATAGLVAAALVSITGPAATSTSAAEPETSTPVPITTDDGAISAYVVNAKQPNPGQTQLIERAVTEAGGVIVQSWPQIGVVVAHATTSSFRTDVAAAAGNALGSVGATRTVPVTEGTPQGVAATWGHGGSANLGGKKAGHDDSTGTESTTATTSDPREAEQWDMRMIKADQAHQITDGSRSVLVGVIDSGIDPDHPDLASNIDAADSVNCTDAGRPDTSATGWYPTASDHGTHVAGTIAAARNGVGIVGVAPNVRLASVKVVNDDGFIYPEYAVCGFMWAALHHMDVTNNSYYVDPFEFYCSDQPDQAAAKEAVARAVAWSIDKGVVSAAAAGNSSYDLANKTVDKGSPDDGTAVVRTINNGCHDIPAELPGVVTVASLEQFPAGSTGSRLSGFSNRGLGVIDVAAPGSRILSTIVANNGYGLKSGTSMASPHVAGVLALMKSAHPNWSPAKILAAVRAEADDKPCSAAASGAPCVGTPENNSYFGEGVVDALDAVK